MNLSHCFSVDFKEHQESYFVQLHSLLKREETADLTLVCQDGFPIAVHKALLGLFSPILSKWRKPYVELPQFSPETVRSMVNFLYFGTTTLDKESVDSFKDLARFFQIHSFDDNYDNVLDSEFTVGESSRRRFRFAVKPNDKAPHKWSGVDSCEEEEPTNSSNGLPQSPSQGCLELSQGESGQITRSSGTRNNSQDSGKLVCLECGRRFYGKAQLEHHVADRCHKPTECLNCGKRFTHIGNRKQHEAVCKRNAKHQCRKCGKALKNEKSKRFHENDRCQTLQRCIHCERHFKNHFHRYKHEKLCRGDLAKVKLEPHELLGKRHIGNDPPRTWELAKLTNIDLETNLSKNLGTRIGHGCSSKGEFVNVYCELDSHPKGTGRSKDPYRADNQCHFRPLWTSNNGGLAGYLDDDSHIQREATSNQCSYCRKEFSTIWQAQVHRKTSCPVSRHGRQDYTIPNRFTCQHCDKPFIRPDRARQHELNCIQAQNIANSTSEIANNLVPIEDNQEFSIKIESVSALDPVENIIIEPNLTQISSSDGIPLLNMIPEEYTNNISQYIS